MLISTRLACELSGGQSGEFLEECGEIAARPDTYFRGYALDGEVAVGGIGHYAACLLDALFA